MTSKFRIIEGNERPVSILKTDAQREEFQLNRDCDILLNRFKEVIKEQKRDDSSLYYDYNTAWMITSCRKNFHNNINRDYHTREDMQTRLFTILCKKRNGDNTKVTASLFAIYLMEQLDDLRKITDKAKNNDFRMPDSKLDQVVRTVMMDMEDCVTKTDIVKICGECIKEYKETGGISI